MQPKTPLNIHLHKHSRTLALDYEGGESYQLPCEYLRVYSPSAEVSGHGPGQEVLQSGKRHVSIRSVEAVGNYALMLRFDDGHDSGIYTWEYLYQLCQELESRWQDYLQRLAIAGASRDPAGPVIIARDVSRTDSQ